MGRWLLQVDKISSYLIIWVNTKFCSTLIDDMDFDPNDPIDPLGTDKPYELQNHNQAGALDPNFQSQLSRASDLVLERARQQAVDKEPIYNEILKEIQSRKSNLEVEPQETITDFGQELPSKTSQSGSTADSTESGDYEESYIESYQEGYQE
jgi:hypothetical protein